MNIQTELNKLGYQARKAFNQGTIEIFKVKDGYESLAIVVINPLQHDTTPQETLKIILDKINEYEHN